MKLISHRIPVAGWALALFAVATAFVLRAQQSPFPTIAPPGQPVPADLPERVPADLVIPSINTEQNNADKLARLFNRDLRDIEERQHEIISSLEALTEPTIESFSETRIGFLSLAKPKKEKWIQIDLGEPTTPEAIALFPVTIQNNSGETIFGYGFPRAFRIDASMDADFSSEESIGTYELEEGIRWPFFKEIGGFECRYIRITPLSYWRDKDKFTHTFSLSEIMIFKGERNVALGKKVQYFPKEGSIERNNAWSHRFVNDGVTAFGIPQGQEVSPSIGYRSKSKGKVRNSWVQVDLGESLRLQEVRMILADHESEVPDTRTRFPYPITVTASDSPDMRGAETLGRVVPQDIESIGNNPISIPVADGWGRYVRLTMESSRPAPMGFSLAELEVYSEDRNVAYGKSVVGSHDLPSNKMAPQYLVDGYSSRRNLTSYPSWVSSLEERFVLLREYRELEKKRRDLVDQTFTRGVISVITGLLGVIALSLIIFTQGRIRRKKDLEDLRQRIASDLHDDIGSNLSSIALLAELGKTEAGEPELVTEELTEIKLTADKTIESMRDIVWLIRPGEETWKQMMTRFRETASKLLRAHEYSFVESGSMHDDRLPLEFKRDFFLIYKEVLNNIVRHAEAKEVLIEVLTTRGKLDLIIKDDGKGFDNLDANFREGNGLRNLRMRAQAIGAKLKVQSEVDSGTTVQLTAPLP